MRFLHFLNEISQHEQDTEKVLDALKNAPSGDYRTASERDEDKEANRTFRNPLPHLTLDDPRFADWYDRGEEILFGYIEQQGWDIHKKGMTRAQNALGIKTTVPINKLIGTESYLEPTGLKRKPGDRFSSELPVIYKVDNNLVISDGNHRVVQAHLNGETEIKALVLDVDALEQGTVA